MPILAADVMYLSSVVNRTGSVSVLVPLVLPALTTHSYVTLSLRPVIFKLVPLLSFLIAGLRGPACLQKTLQKYTI
jgi:hypothetical protein